MIYRLIIFAMFLTGCVSINQQKEIDILKEDIRRLDYYIAHEKCFITYNKCMVEKKANCWSQHERCVVAVWQQWKSLPK